MMNKYPEIVWCKCKCCFFETSDMEVLIEHVCEDDNEST